MKPYTPLSEPTQHQQPLPRTRGQGALEYLLLIGGAILIATVVLLIIVGSSTTTNTIISNNLTNSNTNVNNAFNNAVAGLNAGGGGGAVCGNNTIESGEQCDGTASFAATCYTQGYSAGTLGCNAPATPNQCQFNSSTACSGPGPFIVTNTSFSGGNVTLTVTVPGANGQTGILPYYTVLYLKDNAAPGNLCASYAASIPADPATAINSFITVALAAPTTPTGLAVTNIFPTPTPNTTITPGTPNVPITFATAPLGLIAGQPYCFVIAGTNNANQVGVPVVSSVVTV
jgi:hypothetical protein